MASCSLNQVPLSFPRIPFNSLPISHPKFGKNIFIYEEDGVFHFVPFTHDENGWKMNAIISIGVNDLDLACAHGSGNIKFTPSKNGFFALAHNTQCTIAEFDLEHKSTL